MCDILGVTRTLAEKEEEKRGRRRKMAMAAEEVLGRRGEDGRQSLSRMTLLMPLGSRSILLSLVPIAVYLPVSGCFKCHAWGGTSTTSVCVHLTVY